jgi:repressor of nif and glnA expression
MLYIARERDLTLSEMLPVLEELGYRVAEREIKQELERLTQENFLTAHGDAFSITGTGIEEFKDIQAKLQVLCSEVLTPAKAARTSG